MKTITSITYPVFALFAFACFAAAAGVLGAESIDEGLNLSEQSDTLNVSPELPEVETQTVLGLFIPSTHEDARAGNSRPELLILPGGTTRLWYMNNNVHVGTLAGPHVPAGWYPVSAADFNGDGHIDVLLFNPFTGQTWIGYLFGATQGDYGPTLSSRYQLLAAADFNHDGHPDFVLFDWRTRRTWIWYMNNNIHINTAVGPIIPGPNLALVAVADFNGDGKPDYLLRDLGTGGTLIWYMHNNVHVGTQRGPTVPYGWFFAGATDFNHDGSADYLLQNSRNETAIWYMRNNVVVGSASGPRIPSGWDLFAP